MVRNKDGDGIKSGLIVSEVQKRPCLYDTNHMNYGDRAEKTRSWEEVCESVVPGWQALGLAEKLTAGRLNTVRLSTDRRATAAYAHELCSLFHKCTRFEVHQN